MTDRTRALFRWERQHHGRDYPASVLPELWRCESAEVVRVALAWSRSQDSIRRGIAADVLGQARLHGARTRGRVEAALVRLFNDRDAEVITAAVSAWGMRGTLVALPRIVALARSRKTGFRWTVAMALLGVKDRRAVRALVELSADPHRLVRDWATFALAQLDGDDALVLPALLARLHDEDGVTRSEALKGLASRAHPQAPPAIMAELRADDVADGMVEAAGLLGRTELLPFLLKLCERGGENGWLPFTLDEAIERCSGE